jgi:hypothetical protein
MAGFTTKTFQVHDDYMTPRSAWEAIAPFVPTGAVVWEPFYGDGTSGEYLRSLGFNVIHTQEDFFENDRGDIVVSNPPFSRCADVLKRLVELGKPFILILPVSKICTNYLRRLFTHSDPPIQIIVPRKRIQFVKLVGGVRQEGKSDCNFDCLYYTWKMKLPRDIIWLE